MRQWLRSRLTYANVTATLALFLVLSGGTAVALSGSNTVFTDDIVDNEVRTADVRNDTLSGGGLAAADLRPSSVGSSEAANNSLTGTDVNETTLVLAAGAWREIGAAGQPGFNNPGFCRWSNYNADANHNSVAFLRDRHGFVHLKGLVKTDCNFPLVPEHAEIFNLPAGYWPAKREIHAVLTNNALGRVNVDGPSLDANLGAGAVSVDVSTNVNNVVNWLSLDGISFRCAPSGSNGCP